MSARGTHFYVKPDGASEPIRITIISAQIEAGEGVPGTLLDDRLLIACGSGAIRVLRAKKPGKAAMAARDLLNGLALPAGQIVS